MKTLNHFLFKGKEIPFVEQITVYSEVQHIIGRYSFASKFVEGKEVLEVACGSGYGGNLFMSKGAKSVVGGDLWESAIAHAKSTYRKEGLSYQVLNATKLPFPDSSFDVVISIETIEHVVGYNDFIRECSRVLKNGGVFVCSTPNKAAAQLEQKRFLLKRFVITEDIQNFDVQELDSLLKPHFRETSFYGQGSTPKYIDAVKFKLQSFLKYFSYSCPRAGKIIKFITKNKTLRMYRPMQLPKVEDFDSMLEKEYVVYQLTEDNSVSPHTIIAVARK